MRKNIKDKESFMRTIIILVIIAFVSSALISGIKLYKEQRNIDIQQAQCIKKYVARGVERADIIVPYGSDKCWVNQYEE